uniref:Uncharacterized protein n=1 Tax=Anopheles dirus TaxID=7168 RepID=A0A182NBV2_9DIPT
MAPHITTIEPCLHVDLEGHSMDTFLGATGGLCNYATVTAPPYGAATACYDLAGSLLLPPGPGGANTTALITIETSPSIVLATGPPPPNAANVSIEWHQQQQQQSQHSHACGHRPEPLPATVSFLPAIATADTSPDFVGVGALDILKGVGQDSIIGIRGKALEVNDGKKVVTVIESSGQLPPTSATTAGANSVSPSLSAHGGSGSLPRTAGKAIMATPTTTSAATSPQAPPVPLIPYYSEQQQSGSSSSSASHHKTPGAAPIITVTSTDGSSTGGGPAAGRHTDGMLDRISHDLDYLLNRTTGDVGPAPTSSSVVPIQLRSTTGGGGGGIGTAPAAQPSSQQQGSISSAPPLIPTCHSVHEVIIEESEEVDS